MQLLKFKPTTIKLSKILIKIQKLTITAKKSVIGYGFQDYAFGPEAP